MLIATAFHNLSSRNQLARWTNAGQSGACMPEDSNTLSVDVLREAVQPLVEELAMLTHAIDELRGELTGVVRNGHTPPFTSPVLKRMAADPTAPDWNERLDLSRASDQSPVPRQSSESADADDTVLERNDSAGECSTSDADAVHVEPNLTSDDGERTTDENRVAEVNCSPPAATAPPRFVPGDYVSFVSENHRYEAELCDIDEEHQTGLVYVPSTGDEDWIDLDELHPAFCGDGPVTPVLDGDLSPDITADDTPVPSLEHIEALIARVGAGEFNAVQLKTEVIGFAARCSSFVEMLARQYIGDELFRIADRLGCQRIGIATRRQIATHIFDQLTEQLALGREIYWDRHRETFVQAVQRAIDDLTDEDVAAYQLSAAESP